MSQIKNCPQSRNPVTTRLEKTIARTARKDPRNASLKGKVQVLITVCYTGQTIPITQRTATPSRIL